MTVRRELLDEAADLVDGDRNVTYGDPRQDFKRTAALWSAYLDVQIDPHDVAALMSMLKLSRIRWSPDKRDHWVDLAGYAACGWDCARIIRGDDEQRIADNVQQAREVATDCNHEWGPSPITGRKWCQRCWAYRNPC